MEHNDMVILKLDRPREIRVTHKVLKAFSARFGVSLADMDSALLRYDMEAALVECCLLAQDPTLTPEAVDELLEHASIPAIIRAASDAVAAAFPPPERTDSDPLAAKPPTGIGAIV